MVGMTIGFLAWIGALGSCLIKLQLLKNNSIYKNKKTIQKMI